MKPEDTKAKILEKALELFSENGYDAVSVDQIAKAVGIKAPSLYNHFPVKRAIFDAIVEKTARQYEDYTDESSPEEQRTLHKLRADIKVGTMPFTLMVITVAEDTGVSVYNFAFEQKQ